MATYGVPADRYTFLTGNIFDCLEGALPDSPFDVVFCFGIFYHINQHIRLLEDIFNLGPRSRNPRYESFEARWRRYRASQPAARREQPLTGWGMVPSPPGDQESFGGLGIGGRW